MSLRGLPEHVASTITAYHPTARVHRLRNKKGPDHLTIAVDASLTLAGRHRIARVAIAHGFHVTFETTQATDGDGG